MFELLEHVNDERHRPWYECSVVHIVGTDTDVGKTIATAACAAALIAHGKTVAVYKPAQTGVQPNMPADAQLAAYLSGADSYEGVRLPDAMAPVAAAEKNGCVLPSLDEYAKTIHQLRDSYDVVIVEGSGGVSVDIGTAVNSRGWGHQADLMSLIAEDVHDSCAVIVARIGLGTLNHTLLTYEYLRVRSLNVAGVLIGAMPSSPTEIHRSNLDFLVRLGCPVLGAIPEGAGKSFVVGEDTEFVHCFDELQEFRKNASRWCGIE
ncbi:dethiobiotin synthase [Rothia sp. P6271]|uniref:dethiobiotin synthase n=1 Tax=unclassified Rothia (in: high G+C Gram-positive bacteria) TaxID=2689056 RepID=UPI003AC9E39A